MEYPSFPSLCSRAKGLAIPLAAAFAMSSPVAFSAAEEELDIAAFNTQKENVYIIVKFDGDCPDSVSDDNATVYEEETKRLIWVAVNEDNEPDDSKEFLIYFHPFKHGVEISKKGTVTLKNDNNQPIKKGVPSGAEILYKYTVASNDEDCDPIDPYFRVF